MELYNKLKNKFKKIIPDFLPYNPKSESYHDKLVFYSGTGIILSFLISFGFKTNLKSTIILGIGLPMGYLHRDLMKILVDPTHSNTLDDKEIEIKKNGNSEINNSNVEKK